MAYTFDGPNKLIIITAQTTMSVRDVWSRWVDWALTSDNSKYLPAFRTIGGDIIDATAGTSVPIYAYLQNGWKIRPQESSHTLNVTDGVLLVEGGGDPFVATLGSFVVRINYSQPVQAITVSTGGGAGVAWTDELEAGITIKEGLRVMLAAMSGKVSGADTTTVRFRDLADTKNRITATVDANGNRTGVTLDVS